MSTPSTLAEDDLSGGKSGGSAGFGLPGSHLIGSTPPVDPGEGERERCRRGVALLSPPCTALDGVELWRPQASGDGLRRGRPVEVREDASAGRAAFSGGVA